MSRYNHMYSMAFTVISDSPDGSDVTPDMLRAAAQRRIASIDESGDWLEAAGCPEDSYEEPEGTT